MSDSPDASATQVRYPRTAHRKNRIHEVLIRRQPSLTVVLEDVHDPHNVSAVLRSCDATGVLDVHLIYVQDSPPAKAFNRTTSASAAKWVRTHFYDSVDACLIPLKEQGHTIWATALTDTTHDLYSLDLVQPSVLVLGNEHRGVSPRAMELSDGAVSIPMLGMVESLNISVACAVSLFEAMRQRRSVGMYDQPQLDQSVLSTMELEWLQK